MTLPHIVPLFATPFGVVSVPDAETLNTEVAQLLLQSGGALEVADAAGLAAVVRRLLADSTERQRMGASGRVVIDANRGSAVRVLELVERWL